MTACRLHLRLGRLDLLLLADALQRQLMLLRAVEYGFRLGVLHLRFVDLLAGQRPFLEELLPVVDELLRRVQRLARGVDVGLGFGDLFGHSGSSRRSIVGFRLTELSAALLGCRDEVTVLELGEQLARLHVIAADHQIAADRRADFRDDVRLLARVEDRVGVHDHANTASDGRRHLHGGDRFGLRLLFLARDERGRDRHAAGESNECAHDYSVPVSVCSAASATRYRTRPSS